MARRSMTERATGLLSILEKCLSISNTVWENIQKHQDKKPNTEMQDIMQKFQEKLEEMAQRLEDNNKRHAEEKAALEDIIKQNLNQQSAQLSDNLRISEEQQELKNKNLFKEISDLKEQTKIKDGNINDRISHLENHSQAHHDTLVRMMDFDQKIKEQLNDITEFLKSSNIELISEHDEKLNDITENIANLTTSLENESLTNHHQNDAISNVVKALKLLSEDVKNVELRTSDNENSIDNLTNATRDAFQIIVDNMKNQFNQSSKSHNKTTIPENELGQDKAGISPPTKRLGGPISGSIH